MRSLLISIIGVIVVFTLAFNSLEVGVFFAVMTAAALVCVPLLSGSRGVGENGLYSNGSEAEQRRAALAEAKIFLAPYRNIWRDLRLSNKYCSLNLGHDGVTISCVEKVKPYRRFKIIETHIHTPRELWNLFCVFFSHNKSYDGVVEDCQRYHASIIESLDGKYTKRKSDLGSENISANSDSRNLNTELPVEKLDINNCSEIELTELPGISIVIAKKVIKRREEIGGFKSVEDFLSYIKLKPHMENQLRNRIKVEKMKGSISLKKYSERSVDF